MKETKPLLSETEISEIKNDSENYPKYYVNAGLFSVVKQTSLYQFQRIIYDNQKNYLRKYVGISKNRMKDTLEVIDYLFDFKPCEEKVFEAFRVKAIALFAEYIKMDGFLQPTADTANTADTSKSGDTGVNETQNSTNQ